MHARHAQHISWKLFVAPSKMQFFINKNHSANFSLSFSVSDQVYYYALSLLLHVYLLPTRYVFIGYYMCVRTQVCSPLWLLQRLNFYLRQVCRLVFNCVFIPMLLCKPSTPWCVLLHHGALQKKEMKACTYPRVKKIWILSIKNCLYCFDNNLPTGMIRDFVTEELHICIVLSLHLFVFVSLYGSLPNPSCCSTFLFSLSASQLRKIVSLRHTHCSF